MTEILHPFLTKFRQILRGIVDQYFREKDCFRLSFYSHYPLLSAILKLDFLKGPGKSGSREFKIRRLRTTTTIKHATAHDQNHLTVHFSRVVPQLRWVVELFRVVATTEIILLAFCRLGNSRISSFRKKVFNSPALSEREAKYVSCV